MPNRDGTLKAREFLFFAEDQAMAALPGEFPRPERKVEWTILQLHFGDPRAHIELQPQVARGQVELGLHFEGQVEANDAYAARLAANAVALMAALGPGWELEEWTASWRRLHRTFPASALTTALGREVGAQLANALVTLHPYLTDGQVEPQPPVAAEVRATQARRAKMPLAASPGSPRPRHRR